eukprot:g559.t1
MEYINNPTDQTGPRICECKALYRKTGLAQLGSQVCVLDTLYDDVKTYAENSNVEFRDLPSGVTQTVNSAWISHMQPSAIANCWAFDSTADLASCQAVANMCVLQHFDEDRAACKAFEALKQDNSRSSVHQEDNWKESLPWLLTSAGDKPNEAGIGLNMKMAFAAQPGAVSRLQFKLAQYSFNGTYLGMVDLTDQLSYCKAAPGDELLTGPSGKTTFLNFGFGYTETYTCDLSRLSNLTAPAEQTILYDAYIVDTVQDKSVLTPVYVRNANYRNQAGRLVNQNKKKEDELDDQFSRRFFLFDGITGIKSGTDTPQYLRYASSISLRIETLATSPNNIHAPILNIEYKERSVAEFGEGGSTAAADIAARHTSLEFRVEYTADTSKFWDTTTALFGICIVFVLLLSLLRINNWQRRNTRNVAEGVVNMMWLTRAAVYLASTFAQVFFWLTFVLSCYWYTLFKVQSDVYLLLPPKDPGYGIYTDYYPFEVVLHLCFFFQMMRVIEILCVQCNTDIFFIDWEKPRGQELDHKSGHNRETPISAWRTIMVANEFSELVTKRKTSIELTLVLLAFILKGLGAENYATPQPDASNLSDGEHNMFLRFANTTFWWLIITASQRAWLYCVWLRCFDEPAHTRFIDLCTVAKVSVLLMEEKYHGFYLHCQGSSQYADGDMEEIAKLLENEKNGLATARGLDTDTENMEHVQAFEVHVTAKWRERYNQIFGLPWQRMQQQRDQQQRTGGFFGGMGRQTAAASKELVRASRKLTRFLQDWITKDDHELTYNIPAPMPTCCHIDTNRLLQIPPDQGQLVSMGGGGGAGTGNDPPSILMHDTTDRWTQVMLHGMDHDLLVFNMLTFAMFDYWVGETLVSVLMTYIFEMLVVHIRSRLGTRNLAQKSLVDERFLS